MSLIDLSDNSVNCEDPLREVTKQIRKQVRGVVNGAADCESTKSDDSDSADCIDNSDSGVNTSIGQYSDSSIYISDDEAESQISLESSTRYRPNFSSEQMSLVFWVEEMERLLKICAFLYHKQDSKFAGANKAMNNIKNQISEQYDTVIYKLSLLQSKLKIRNKHKQTCFILLFDLCTLLEETDSRLLLDSTIHNKLIFLLSTWVKGATFNKLNFVKLSTFLKFKYGATRDDWESLRTAWSKTEYYSEIENSKILQKGKNVLEALYWGRLDTLLQSAIKQNVRVLPTIFELAQGDLRCLQEFLYDFQIPFSGPYKRVLNDSTVHLQFFVSGLRKSDSVANSFVPIFGVYAFRLSCLSMNPTDAFKYAMSLPEIPFWLQHVPPLFNKSFSFIRNQIAQNNPN